ncbi:hypothetical protein [Nocardia sp. NPDC050710]|uniref:hypothetical protein n=1 Tax=Nocardia sp. NPDC050710 TaxID=3157220 RepID=UPI003401F470
MLAAALLVSATATGLLAAPSATAAAPEQARVAGCEFGTILGNYDYTRFDDYVQRVLDHSTGEFHAKFAAARSNMQALFEAAQVRSEVTAVECEALSGDANRADILVHTTAAVRNRDNNGSPQSSRTSTVVALENVDGRWLVARVDVR